MVDGINGEAALLDNTNGEARAEVLARVRRGLGVRGDEPGRRGNVQFRLRNPTPNAVPDRGRIPRIDRIKLFQAMLETGGATSVRVRTLKALPEAIAVTLRDQNLPYRLRMGSDPAFALLKAEPGPIEIVSGKAEAADAVSLSHAFAGAAETGTLFLSSGPDNPSTLNFLPQTHLAVVSADDIFGSYEECWTKLRAMRAPSGTMPRTVNLISGPSRTADIEQTIVLGAHGPKTLIVYIAGG